MLSSTLALFTRSFRVDARSTQPHVLRLVFAGAILLALVWIHKMEVIFGAPGLTVFRWISWLNFIVITLAGLGYFATAISEEKEEDSLGLLKMAGISPVALLLGKSTTRLIAVSLMMAVEFPFVLLSITLGGITMTQVIAMAMALASYLVFIANLGLVCSVVGSTSRRACTLMTLSLVVILIAFPWFGAFATHWSSIQTSDTLGHRILQIFARWESDTSMWNRLSTILSTGFSESVVSRQVLCHLAAALGFFGLSWLGFEKFTQEGHAVRPLETIFARSSGGRQRSPVGRPWALALAWKDFHFVSGGTRMAVLRALGYFAIIGLLFWLSSWGAAPYSRFSADELGRIAMTITLIFGALELGLVASRVFHAEVKAHTLPLLMLPASSAQIAWEKAASAVPALIPAAAIFLLGALLDLENFTKGAHSVLTSWPGWYVIVLFIFSLFLAAYLSLVVKWGALPLTICMIVFAHMILIPMITIMGLYFRTFMQSEAPAFIFLLSLAGGGIVILSQAIPRRLRMLAGR